MIPVIVRHLTDNHIRDTRTETLPWVFETYKKGKLSKLMAIHQIARTRRCNAPTVSFAFGRLPLPKCQEKVG